MISNELLWPLVTALVLASAGGWWFGVVLRSREESKAGVQALAALKWRECAALLLGALQKRGLIDTQNQSIGSDNSSEFLLSTPDKKILLCYKHGTAYKIGDDATREMFNAMSLAGVESGILATLGSTEVSAVALAGRANLELLDGHGFWQMVRPVVSDIIRESSAKQARDKTRKQLWLSGLASVLAGLVVYLAVSHALADFRSTVEQLVGGSEPTEQTKPMQVAAITPVATASPDSQAAALPADVAANQPTDPAVETIDTDAQSLPRLRAEVARTVASQAGVEHASWMSSSTLNIALKDASAIDTLIPSVCVLLQQSQELEFSRLQFQMPQGSNPPVRWRRCG